MDKSSDIKGTYTLDRGQRYTNPEWSKIEGKGSIQVDDEDIIYVGGEVDGLKHGFGVCTYPDRSIYDGEWSKGLKHGSGIYLYSGIIVKIR